MHFISRGQALLLPVTFKFMGLIFLVRSNTSEILSTRSYIFSDLISKACEKISKKMYVVRRFSKYGAKVSLTK